MLKNTHTDGDDADRVLEFHESCREAVKHESSAQRNAALRPTALMAQVRTRVRAVAGGK